MYMFILICTQKYVYTVAGLCTYFFVEVCFPMYDIGESALLLDEGCCVLLQPYCTHRSSATWTQQHLAVVLVRRAAELGLQHYQMK